MTPLLKQQKKKYSQLNKLKMKIKHSNKLNKLKERIEHFQKELSQKKLVRMSQRENLISRKRGIPQAMKTQQAVSNLKNYRSSKEQKRRIEVLKQGYRVSSRYTTKERVKGDLVRSLADS
jgi:hypothetical protein